MNLDKLQQLATTIRMLSAEAVQAANAGHPGMPMGAADMASVLWTEHMRFDPQDPEWLGRDRFVLSAGHGSMLLYSLLHLFDCGLSLDEIKNFRQWESLTPGHPEYGLTPGVETTTGPLGQGFANGVGMALSSKLLEARYKSDLFAHRVFGIVSDGDLMEGISAEAASLAGHLELGNLIYLYDDNHISIGGDTDVCFSEDVPKRFDACGWHVVSVDGHDLEAVKQALDTASAEKTKPSLICARTIIGKGSPAKAGTAGVHGAPLGEEELQATRSELNWSEAPFTVPQAVKEFCQEVTQIKTQEAQTWRSSWESWTADNSELAESYHKHTDIQLSSEAKAELIATFNDAGKAATRALSGKAIQVIAKHVPAFVGGSADLEPSTITLIDDSPDVAAGKFEGKNLRFGVREHAMGAICNGLAYSKHWLPYTATFLVFADYMRPTIRLAALSHLRTLFIFTHDSFWVGEDGPTHQPVEHIESLRLIPNLYVFRPADPLEVALCYEAALSLNTSPSALLFTRQGVNPIDRNEIGELKSVMQGAYAVNKEASPDVLLVATGSEVNLACETADILKSQGKAVRVISMPCTELFLKQDQNFKDELLPTGVPTVVVEAGTTSMWPSILQRNCLCVGKEDFGASAPGSLLAEKFGFSSETVSGKVLDYLKSF